MYKHLGYEIVEYQENEYGNGIHRYLMKKILVIWKLTWHNSKIVISLNI